MRVLGRPNLHRTNYKLDPRRPAGQAAVNVVLAVANDHDRCRIRQQFAGPLDLSQPTHALLVFNGALAAWRGLDRVVTGPDMRVRKTENSLRLAVDVDQGMDETAGRNPIAGRTKTAAMGLVGRRN